MDDVRSICGMVKLCAVIERDDDLCLRLYRKLGLKEESCPICGGFVSIGHIVENKRTYPYCSGKCKTKARLVPVVCDNCGKLFYRKDYTLTLNIGKHNYQHLFCSNQCQGVWAGKHYGWGRK